MEAALASVARMEEEIDDTEVRAPFAGIVEYRHVDIGDYVKQGAPVATVVDQDPYLVIGYVSEQDVGKIGLNNRGSAKLITGETLSGRIRYIASMAEPETRTFRIELEVPNPDESLRDGITAEIRVGVETVAAHFVSPAVLTLDQEGVVGVRLVDEGNRVVFHRAEIVGDSEGGVWLADLPETVRLITVGQEFVREGDVVEASPEEAAPDA
jgi:multidrug efflux system membrane fusion protein